MPASPGINEKTGKKVRVGSGEDDDMNYANLVFSK